MKPVYDEQGIQVYHGDCRDVLPALPRESVDLVLSIFPGIGLLDRAFEETGFCVVRGPDLLWGGNIHTFHPPPGVFAGIIGGPPCQAFSRLRYFHAGKDHKQAENLIPEYERVVGEAQPVWFLMENVPDAPEPSVPGYRVRSILFNNRWTGAEQDRVRRFSFGTHDGRTLTPGIVALENPVWARTVVARGGSRSVARNGRASARANDVASNANFPESLRLQGLPPDFLADAPFTVRGKHRVVGNGVPLQMGRAIAAAVRTAMEEDDSPSGAQLGMEIEV